MNYRSLLLHLDDRSCCAERIEVAIGLARRLACHLEGLASLGPSPLIGDIGPGTPGLDSLVQAVAELRRRADTRAARFLDRCATSGLTSYEANVISGDGIRSLVRQAHYADLLIVSQAKPDEPNAEHAHDLVEHAVLHAARPVLVVPYAGRFGTVGERVLIAWDDSRAAARAVSDALPLLARAAEVRVLQLSTPAEASRSTGSLLDPLQQWLRRHGIEARTAVEAFEIDVGQALLARAADVCADLVVMGAYGHARWTERILGGATRSALSSMPVPVLMSR